MSISFGISTFCIKGSTKNIYLFLLLLISILIETSVQYLVYFKQNHFILYHFFTPVEYCLLSLYCYRTTQLKTVQRVILISIILFFILAVFTINDDTLLNFPSVTNGIESLMLIVLSTIILLNIEPITKVHIYAIPEFWIALSILIYFTGTFFFNGAYNFLKNSNSVNIKDLFTIINTIFNCLFYLLLSYGLICYYRFKKYN
jgi:hypothetical protein